MSRFPALLALALALAASAADQTLPLGAWFFDPILILKRHFGLFDTREKYLYNPYLGIGDPDSGPRKATTP